MEFEIQSQIALSNESTINTHELAWAAGFFDGEGCVSTDQGKPKLTIQQNDPRVLERFKKAVGELGKVYGPYQSRTPLKQVWQWRACKRAEVELGVFRLWPFLSPVKRKQVEDNGLHG